MRLVDADQALIGMMRARIEAEAVRGALWPPTPWRPGRPLELLLVGYNGCRNTGADVRVSELVRQLRHLLGDVHAGLSVTTLGPEWTQGYFPGARQIALSRLQFPAMLPGLVAQSDGVLACEGSMFKSRFANALSLMMAGALGLSLARGGIAVGYGGEAGHMEPALERFVRATCAGALVLARTAPSLAQVQALGLRARLGTDTAWTCTVPDAPGRALLEAAGWDGERPVLTLCPINPFWWPVRPDPVRAGLLALSGQEDESHNSAIYFHRAGPAVDAAQARYLDGLAEAAHAFAQRHGAMIAIVGMEARDERAARQLAARRPGGAPVFSAADHPWLPLVSLLRQSRWLVSSRYHALVCAMPAQVPLVGVSMDERIHNLLSEQGAPELCLPVDADDLGARLLAALDTIEASRPAQQARIGAHVAEALWRQGQMGSDFLAELRRHHPAFPVRAGLGPGGDPLAHLPPLSPAQHALLEAHPPEAA